MKNIIYLFLDSLSAWYIDQLKTKGGIWDVVKNEAFVYENLYAAAPFTQGAVMAKFDGEEVLSNQSYFPWVHSKSYRLLDESYKKGYVYYHCQGGSKETNYSEFEQNPCIHWGLANHDMIMWAERIVGYYKPIFDSNTIMESDYLQLEIIFDNYFNDYLEKKECEKKKYSNDKRLYIKEVLSKGEKSSFFELLDKSYYVEMMYPVLHYEKELRSKPPSSEELKFLSFIKEKNVGHCTDNMNYSEAASFLSGWEGVERPAKILYQMRNGRLGRRCMGEELELFEKWYSFQRESEKPFLAMLVMADFHDIVCSSRNIASDDELYKRVIKEKQSIPVNNKNVMAELQITFREMEKYLAQFYNWVKEKDVLNDTYLVITADHGRNGIINKWDGGWYYTKRMFHVPFYVLGKNISPQIDRDWKTQYDVFLELNRLLGLKLENHEFEWRKKYKDISFTYWVNGLPDLRRKKIKVGVRNKHYSITYENYVTSFFGGGAIVACYDLKNDPDELMNISENVPSDIYFEEIKEYLKEIWFELICSLLLDKKNLYGYKEKYGFLEKEKETYRGINSIEKSFSSDFSAHGKKVIVYGVGVNTIKLIFYKRLNIQVYEYWDATANDNTFFAGQRVVKPHAINNPDDYIVVVSPRFSIDMIYNLRNMGYMNYIIAESL